MPVRGFCFNSIVASNSIKYSLYLFLLESKADWCSFCSVRHSKLNRYRRDIYLMLLFETCPYLIHIHSKIHSFDSTTHMLFALQEIVPLQTIGSIKSSIYSIHSNHRPIKSHSSQPVAYQKEKEWETTTTKLYPKRIVEKALNVGKSAASYWINVIAMKHSLLFLSSASSELSRLYFSWMSV